MQTESSSLLGDASSPLLVATAPAGGCPYAHAAPVVQRSHADMVVRKLLRIREKPAAVSSRQAVERVP